MSLRNWRTRNFHRRITNVGSIADAVAASELQIFTREGRHIAGVAFTDAQITEYMTSGNGFDDSAVYSSEYLNNTQSAYRGIDMDVSFAGGMHTLKIGSNGIGPALAQGTTIVPGNATLAQTCLLHSPMAHQLACQ